jgi:valyl-tRNA synthetase
VVADATAALEAYDYTRALERTERFFWRFCDDYLELVKARAYREPGDAGADSAHMALSWALDTLLRLFAPFLPFVTEEVWSWSNEDSIHRSEWPFADCLASAAGLLRERSDDEPAPGDPLVLEVAAEVLGEVRKAKTTAQRSLRTEVVRIVVTDTPARLAALAGAVDDVAEAGRIAHLELVEGPIAGVDVTLVEG